MRKLTDISKVPPSGYTYVHKQTGTKLNHINVDVLKLNVKKFFIANSYPIGLLWDQEFEDNVSENLHPDVKDRMSEIVTPKVVASKRSLNVSDVKMFLWTFMSWTKKGFPVVSQEEANRRAAICAACPFNVPIEGCTSCSHFPELLMQARGTRGTPLDSRLNACSICACSLKASVWMPREVKTEFMPEAYVKLLPSHCWMLKSNDSIGNLNQSKTDFPNKSS